MLDTQFLSLASGETLLSDVALALIFLILAGPMLMPALAATARSAWWATCAVARVALHEAVSHVAFETLKWGLLLLATFLGLGFAPAGAEPPRTEPPAVVAVATPDPAPLAARTLDQTIDDLLKAIRMARKPLPAWALDAAETAYKMLETYRNGQKVEDMRRNVGATLRLVDEMRRDIEGGRETTDKQYRLVREALDAHGTALTALAGRVDDLERWTRERVEAQARQMAEVARLNEANHRFATANDLKAREIERLARDANERVQRAREQLNGVSSIVRRPGCGEGRYWDRAEKACVSK